VLVIVVLDHTDKKRKKEKRRGERKEDRKKTWINKVKNRIGGKKRKTYPDLFSSSLLYLIIR
jgi:hypothetical protein